MADQNLDVVRRQLEARRRQKDQWALHSPNSPLDEHQRATVPGPGLLPGRFRLPRRRRGWSARTIRTRSRFRPRPASGASTSKVGAFHFEIDGQPLTLSVFQPTGDKAHTGRKALFMPFRDRTSGRETYGAGRYLDLAENRDGSETYILDFNEAYNPYCAYSPNWSCTIPPRENTLPVEIRAGEKNLPGHDDSH